MQETRLERLKKELLFLRERLSSLPKSEQVAHDIWEIGVSSPDFIPLTISVLVHGNETGGIGVLNELVTLLQAGFPIPKGGVCLIIGNDIAALQGKRFLDRDLNRSFGMTLDGTREALRASEMAPFLKKSRLYLDIHQTLMSSDRGFFIFPYKPKALSFSKSILPRATTVTHWGKPFSAAGMCTDEYVGQFGGVGITLELGQNGFDPFQVSLGLQAVVNAFYYAMDPYSLRHPEWLKGELFTWQKIVDWPLDGDAQMDEGWSNFRPILKGERMGTHDGKVVTAPESGWMLFPKYFTPEVPQTSRPSEMYRIMKKITELDLPD